MEGMKAIAKNYGLKVHEKSDFGPYEWKRRMGIHLAFHRDPVNIFLHAVFSIMNAWAILLIAFPFQVPGFSIFSVPVDMAMLVLVAVLFIYALMVLRAAM